MGSCNPCQVVRFTSVAELTKVGDTKISNEYWNNHKALIIDLAYVY
jgi:hypothetical protein